MSYEKLIRIPSDRIGALIGKSGKSKKLIEDKKLRLKLGKNSKTMLNKHYNLENNIPIIYLVDSAGAFLPMQDQVFPDETHFGRIFYNNGHINSRE